ncbi:hypothetical protein F4679DRAFT_530063 [Xylaria curta]|nr:hypothetical protein F4679DRAFT_530063 [Xylaria curta]
MGDTTEETCNKSKRALDSAGQWVTTHASIFAPEKFQHTSPGGGRESTRNKYSKLCGAIYPRS